MQQYQREDMARPAAARVLPALLAALLMTGLIALVVPIPTASADSSEEASGPGVWTSARPDGHAPIGVMGDHTHAKGEIMLSFRTMYVEMNGNRDGTDGVSNRKVLDTFMIAPRSMQMEMYMPSIMYAVTSKLTLMAMVPFVRMQMSHVTRTGDRFSTTSQGLGDIRLSGLYNLVSRGWHRLHLNIGLSVPTGSTNKRDDTPMGQNVILPYPMQLGSGTVDAMPGLTYFGESPNWSWGGQSIGTIRIGENSHDYTLGDRATATVWGARRWADWVSTSMRADFQYWKNIDGADPRLPGRGATVVPTARPDLRGGKRLDLLWGVNFKGTGDASAHRLLVEAGLPVYQDLDGPQLETDWLVTAGWQFSY